MFDVRVRRGADVGSDNFLVLARVKLRLRGNQKKCTENCRIDVKLLKEPARKRTFITELKNRYEALAMEENATIKEHWNTIAESLRQTGTTLRSEGRERMKRFLSDETWQLIGERKGLKNKIKHTISQRQRERLCIEHAEKQQLIKKAARSDKRKALEAIAVEAA